MLDGLWLKAYGQGVSQQASPISPTQSPPHNTHPMSESCWERARPSRFATPRRRCRLPRRAKHVRTFRLWRWRGTLMLSNVSRRAQMYTRFAAEHIWAPLLAKVRDPSTIHNPSTETVKCTWKKQQFVEKHPFNQYKASAYLKKVSKKTNTSNVIGTILYYCGTIWLKAKHSSTVIAEGWHRFWVLDCPLNPL